MAKGVHKGTELNNVKETWDQNERLAAGTDKSESDNSGLQQVIREEASEYDEADKESRLLGGERATLRDDEKQTPGEAP